MALQAGPIHTAARKGFKGTVTHTFIRTGVRDSLPTMHLFPHPFLLGGHACQARNKPSFPTSHDSLTFM